MGTTSLSLKFSKNSNKGNPLLNPEEKVISALKGRKEELRRKEA